MKFRKISALLLALAMVFALAACSGSSSESGSSSDAAAAQAEAEPAEEEEEEEPAEEEEEPEESEPAESETDGDVVLYDGSAIKISFQKIYEIADLPGMCYIQLLYENKTDEEITVYPSEAYVNDFQVTMGSGTATEMAAGKKSQNPICFSCDSADIEEIEEIESIEIAFWVVDEEFNTLEETDLIRIFEQ